MRRRRRRRKCLYTHKKRKRKPDCKAKQPRKDNRTPQKKPDKVVVSKERHSARRFQMCHNKFLNYNEIKNFLSEMQRAYPGKLQVQVIGHSAEGRAIFLAIISCGGNPQQPKMATMIEAGANGDEWLTISTALYMIDFLAKNPNFVKIMDYFIIPCSNPDAYENSLCNTNKSNVAMCLSNNFPVLLGSCDMTAIRTDTFLDRIKDWKERYKCNAPETLAVIKAVVTYQFAVKLFISLQGDGTSITYPYGFCQNDVQDAEDLKRLAKAGQQGVKSRCFQIGSVYNVSGLTYGNIIDFLRTNRSSIKFTYVVHVNKKQKKLEPGNIICYGQEVMNCVRFMGRGVFMFYNQDKVNHCKSFF
ncbi:hypothetical protein NQ317_001700 [Molorchus minor]|uniref:Peptidase M14 domain-containing protein n=1 Tax=Molorchus minor TaxID=1323400 RepID=A0ABQ9J4U2_9CUCU|nr:hypothetical protein NQ317_001700 [Molorchus minor]